MKNTCYCGLVAALLAACLHMPGCASSAKPQRAPSAYNGAFERGDYQTAYNAASVAANSGKDANHSHAALIAGLSAHRLGDDAEAARWLEPLRDDPNNRIAGAAGATLGLIARTQKNNSLAATRFADAAIRLDGDDRARADLYAGEALENLGRPHAASVHYTAAASHASDPQLLEALRLRLNGKSFTVQIGAFRDKRRADALAREATDFAHSVGASAPRVVPDRAPDGSILYLVHVGRFITRTEAESVVRRYDDEGVIAVTASR